MKGYCKSLSCLKTSGFSSPATYLSLLEEHRVANRAGCSVRRGRGKEGLPCRESAADGKSCGGESTAAERKSREVWGLGGEEQAFYWPPDSRLLLLQILGQDFFPSGARVKRGGQRCPGGELTARTKPKPPLICGSMNEKLGLRFSGHQLDQDAQSLFYQ